jgi:hypothetical protein
MVSDQIALASHSTLGVRHADLALVTGRSGQSHHPADDPLTISKVLVGNGAGGECYQTSLSLEAVMGFGRGALLWLLGVPLPIIILLALFMHH